MYLVLCGVKSTRTICYCPRSRMSRAILVLLRIVLDGTSSGGGRWSTVAAPTLRCASPPHSSGHCRQTNHSGPVPGRGTSISHMVEKTLTEGGAGGSAVGGKWRPTDPITPDYTSSLAGSNIITILGRIVVSSRDNWSIENTTTTTTTHLSLVASHRLHTPFSSAVSRRFSHFQNQIIPPVHGLLVETTMDDKTVSPLATISAGMATSAPTSPRSGGGGGSAKGGGGVGGARTCDNCRKRKVSRVDRSGTR